jgi:adenosylmethionine-8-amino-7-oxononanoate aminotransferase
MGLLGRTGDRGERQHALAPDIVAWAIAIAAGVLGVAVLLVTAVVAIAALIYVAGRITSVLTYGG